MAPGQQSRIGPVQETTPRSEEPHSRLLSLDPHDLTQGESEEAWKTQQQENEAMRNNDHDIVAVQMQASNLTLQIGKGTPVHELTAHCGRIKKVSPARISPYVPANPNALIDSDRSVWTITIECNESFQVTHTLFLFSD